MKVNKWTVGLAAAGLVSLPAGLLADEATKMNQVWTALSSTTISGYVDTSAQWNFGTGNANPARYSYAAGKADGFNLNVAKLAISKPLDEAQWAAGYQVDLLFGPDARSLNTLLDAGDQAIPMAIQQAYAALRAPLGNGLDFKVGVFNSIIGYESFDSYKNPNWTRSYGYTMEPTTHEGVLVSYQFTDWLTAQAGVANTFGPVIGERAHDPDYGRAESYKTYMGSLAFTVPKDTGFLEGSTLYVGAINGLRNRSVDTDNATGKNVTLPLTDTHLYAGATLNTPVKDMKVGAAFDYAWLHAYDTAHTYNERPWEWNIAGYASWKLAEKWSVHGRGEYYRRSEKLDDLPNVNKYYLLPPKAVECTFTVQYDLWKNVITRAEFRWDHAANGEQWFGGTDAGNPTRKNQYILAGNIVYQF
jgi:hypothetical protein